MHLETTRKIAVSEVRKLLEDAPGVTLLDGDGAAIRPRYRTPRATMRCSSAGCGLISVTPHGINLWVVADNVRKGAALNSVQIAEILAKNYL